MVNELKWAEGVKPEPMLAEYIEWCKTEEGKQYLEGGSKYKE